jgi:glycosyltransferase involved in cell wall biosynthesis
VSEPTISVLIPYRNDGGDHRAWLFQWVLQRWNALLPSAEVVVRSGGPDGPFNRSRAINNAAADARGDVFVIADADTVFHLDELQEAIRLCLGGTWVLPYGPYVNLDAISTHRVLARPADTDIAIKDVSWDHLLMDSVSGLVVLTREQFGTAGGFDERFERWGFEDRAFQEAADRLVGGHVRVDGGYCFHLWHPRGADFEGEQIPRARRLYASYQMARTPAQMRQLVETRGRRAA